MTEKQYLHILFLCVILSQGITGSFIEEDTGESSNLLVREKRVINRIPGEDRPVGAGVIPYLVNIKENNRMECVGAILSHRTVITSARCVIFDVSAYKVHSGSVYLYEGTPHNVTGKKIHNDDSSSSSISVIGIALIFVQPAFVYEVYTKNINLHRGPILTGMNGIVSGWGARIHGGRRETAYPVRVRLITVPIISHRSCVESYEGLFRIRDDYICTFHEKKQCGNTDAGAPLVIEGELAGIHVGVILRLRNAGCNNKPDVYALLQHQEYSDWILSNIED